MTFLLIWMLLLLCVVLKISGVLVKSLSPRRRVATELVSFGPTRTAICGHRLKLYSRTIIYLKLPLLGHPFLINKQAHGDKAKDGACLRC